MAMPSLLGFTAGAGKESAAKVEPKPREYMEAPDSTGKLARMPMLKKGGKVVKGGLAHLKKGEKVRSRRISAARNVLGGKKNKKNKISPSLLKWRAKQKEGAIMKPKIFKNIERKAAAGGATDPKAVAGAAYWKTAKAKFRER